MGVAYNPTINASGLILNLDVANPKSYSPNVFPNSRDLFAWVTGTNGSSTIARDTSIARSPAGGIPLKMSITGNDPYMATYNAAQYNLAPASSGQTWTVSVWARASTNTTGEIFIFGDTAAGAQVFTYNDYAAGSITITTEWTRVSFTYTFTNAGTQRIQTRLDGTHSGGSGIDIWWDGLQVERRSSPSEFNPTLNPNGTVWTDLSLRRLNGQIYNSPAYVNNVFTFDGTNDYIGLPSPSSRWNWTPGNLANSNEYSFEMWVNSSDTSGFYFSKPWNGNGEYNYQATHNSWFTSVGNQSHSQSFTSLATGTWQHAVFIVNATQKAVYRNGVIDAAFTNHSITNVSPTSGNNGEDLAIMTLYPYGESAWNQPTHAIAGSLALFRAYNTVLSPQEILRNYMAQKGRFGL